MDRLLLGLVLETRAGGLVWALELCLDLSQLPPRQHLDVRADLLPRPRLAGPQLDVPSYQLVPPVHLPLVRQDDLPPTARRVDGQRFHEALLYLRSPNSLGVLVARVLVVVELARVVLCDLGADRLRDARQTDCIVSLWRSNS